MAQHEWLSPAFCQGFRCGHLEGRLEAMPKSHDYIHGLSLEAAENQTGLAYLDRQEWASGYRYGFETAGRGKPVPRAIAEAPLPNTEAR